jgi:hypothetical protein
MHLIDDNRRNDKHHQKEALSERHRECRELGNVE